MVLNQVCLLSLHPRHLTLQNDHLHHLPQSRWVLYHTQTDSKKLMSETLFPEQHPNYPCYKHKPFPGWIFNRKIVRCSPLSSSLSFVSNLLYQKLYLNHSQTTSFPRANSFIFSITNLQSLEYLWIAISLILTRIWKSYCTGSWILDHRSSHWSSNSKKCFQTISDSLIIIALHDTSILKILIIITSNLIFIWIYKTIQKVI